MADHCSFCDTRRPAGGTNMLILNLNDRPGSWLEFCQECGEKEELTNGETGETIKVVELFNRLAREHGKPELPRLAPGESHGTRGRGLCHNDEEPWPENAMPGDYDRDVY